MSHLRTRRALAAAAAISAGLAATAAMAATCPEGYPDKPIRFVVGFGAGGGTDTIARSLTSAIEQQQGWTTVVENMPGAGGANAAVWLKSQPADGYLVGVTGTDAIAVNPAMGDVGYTWEDFDYLGSGMQTWLGLAALADAPFDDLPGLIEHARENGRATVAVAGINQEVLIRQLAEEYDVELVAIPGAGAAEALTSALGGHVDATTQGTLHVEQITAGTMKLVTSLIDRRVPYAPDVGTLAEQGSSAQPLNSHTIFITPDGLPDDLKTCLAEAIDEAVQADSYKAQMATFQNEALNLGPEGNEQLVKQLAEFYAEMLGS
ncbi:MAG TPA: tripartite tricarboxylate transporter substrate binding protein [Devosiaceae bacterium]|nr:tripartite tricarboxylate transporter substrate binding protein [Devosiaceae bacterium]